ncbi:MAG: hypothetical protein NW215_15970 [Hyphomicrobiales bacterium]|nr:hypothetical protein [Hyphomicrobiales bacterium]
MAKTQIGDTLVFKPSRGLRTMLTISFALLLVFIANAAAGSVWLASRSLWGDATVFFLMLGVGAVLLLLNAVFLFAASHVEVRMEPEKCVMVLPNWRGPTPLFPYTQTEIPYKDVAAVETRSEFYKYFALPVAVHASSFVRRDGKRYTLGYMRESSEDHAVPYREIADELARRAGVPVTHRGVVAGGGRGRAILNDEPAWDAPALDESSIAALRSREGAFMKLAAGVFIAFVAVGLTFQVIKFAGLS